MMPHICCEDIYIYIYVLEQHIVTHSAQIKHIATCIKQIIMLVKHADILYIFHNTTNYGLFLPTICK